MAFFKYSQLFVKNCNADDDRIGYKDINLQID